MNTGSFTKFNAFFIGLVLLFNIVGAEENRHVSFEYAPPEWQTAICLPDDPYKTLVDRSGRLLYHFNGKHPNYKNPSRDFGTTVHFEVGKKNWQTGQKLISPRIPIVKTSRLASDLIIDEEAFAVTGIPGSEAGSSRNDVILVTIRNVSPKAITIRPEFIINSGFRLKRVNHRAVLINGQEMVHCTYPLASIKILSSKAKMVLKPISVNSREIVQFAIIYCGGDEINSQPMTLKDVLASRARAERYWQEVKLPFDTITIPDPGIQALVDSSIRNIWQAREIKEGLPAFQVGSTIYRGLWVVDGAFLLEAAALVGAGDEARAGVQYMLSKQSPSGSFEVLTPKFYKENGIVLWTCVRHAMLTQDKKWLRSVWPKLEKTAAFIKTLRQRSYDNSTWLCQGLIPPGDIDGGLGDPKKGEYTNVYWNLLGLKSFIQAARWIGNDEQAEVWQSEYDDFYAVFLKAAKRDMQIDPAGNTYLPTIMNNLGNQLPQRAQWAFCHGVYPGQIFTQDDPLVKGNLEMLAATEQEGMVYGTGWDAEGFWNYFASFYGHAWLWQGNGSKACDALYAFANHASPLLAWREEQSPKGEPYKIVGDMPHNWASAEFIRLAVHLLALDRGNELHLFEGMPSEWARQGMRTALKGVATPFGPLSFDLKVSLDGSEAILSVDALSDPSCKKINVHLGEWTGIDEKQVIELDPGKNNRVTIPLAMKGKLGTYFKKKEYTPEALPEFETTREKLPQPIYDENPGYVTSYWKSWELAFKQFRKPSPTSPFVSNYIDEAYNEALFLWDTAFMTLFCNYGHSYVPGIQSLDSFYSSQMEDGEIVREISEVTGEPRARWAKPGTPASLNHPILAWAELESYKISNDIERLKLVYPPLAAYYAAYEKILDERSGFYLGSWASMDNSPRIKGMLCGIDTTAEVVLFARNLAAIARAIGLENEAENYDKEADELSVRINGSLWNPKTNFYYDLNQKWERHDVKTIAGFWPLLAKIADNNQAAALVRHLENPKTFNRKHRIPTAPADERMYESTGHYWRGGVWTPTNIMVIKGLENYGYDKLAAAIADNHMDNVQKVYEKTGTVWEFYQPDSEKPGYQPGHYTRPDFTGWTANAPITLFIEYKLGFRINAPENKITWTIRSDKRIGIEKLWFGGNTVSIVADSINASGKRIVSVETEKPFELIIRHNGSERHIIVEEATSFVLE